MEAWHAFAADPSLLAQKADEVECIVHGNQSYRPGEQKRMTANAALASIASLDFEDDFELMGGSGNNSIRSSQHSRRRSSGEGGGGSRLSHSKPNPITVSSRKMSIESTGEEAPPPLLKGWLTVYVNSSDSNNKEEEDGGGGEGTTNVKKKKPLYKRKPKFMKNFKKKSITEDCDNEDEASGGAYMKKYVFIDQSTASLVFSSKKVKSPPKYESKNKDGAEMEMRDLRLVGNIEINHNENLEHYAKDKSAEDVDVEAGLKLASQFFIVDDWKFQAESSEDALKWVDALEDWRDWLLLHAPF